MRVVRLVGLGYCGDRQLVYDRRRRDGEEKSRLAVVSREYKEMLLQSLLDRGYEFMGFNHLVLSGGERVGLFMFSTIGRVLRASARARLANQPMPTKKEMQAFLEWERVHSNPRYLWTTEEGSMQ